MSITAELRSAEHGHAWTEGQRAATKSLLMSSAATIGVQGSAGTAKITTVLKEYARAARARGLTVRAIAPTATAAATLADAIDAKPMTVALMLMGTNPDIKHGREAWIVDEASMMSARDTDRLFAQAQETGARVVLVGDVAQLGSVQAGRAFGQLQDAGMPTFVLDQIVRQTNAHTREAVEAMLTGDAAAAFDALDRGGGRVVEQPDPDARVTAIARDFAKLSPEERAGTLVLDPTREGRQRLTDAIRAELGSSQNLFWSVR
nr:AAA family ATPase [Sphingomonas sp. GC_Shp_3]